MKNKLLILFVFAGILFSLNFISADENVFGCCRKTTSIDGGFCLDFPLNSDSVLECDGAIAQTSCAQVPDCQLGTCISKSGYCSPNRTPKIVCDSTGGTWYPQSRNQIPQCEIGCCILNNGWSVLSQTECVKQYAIYGVNTQDIQFFKGITSEDACSALTKSKEEGACVYPGQDDLKSCTRTYEDNCLRSGGKFYSGFLCTAKDLNTKCAKTTNTVCDGVNVYYKDSCGNLANLVDKIEEAKNSNYWEKIIKNSECVYDLTNPNSCGKCDYTATFTKDGNKCDVVSGQAKCVSMGCKHQGKEYSNGESWCASIGGSTIIVDPFDSSKFLNEDDRKKIENSYLTENIPGSRYYKFTCFDGKIYQENCMDYRNEVCKQTFIGLDKNNDGVGDFSHASCVINNWRDCFSLTSKTACESPEYDCKWLGGEKFFWGYRYDGKIYPWDGKDKKQEQDRIEYQGSCVPLYAPGFDFWSDKNKDSQTLCLSASVQEIAIFETGLGVERDDELAEWSTKEIARQCFEGGCYAIPDYGLEPNLGSNLEDTLKIFLGGDAPGNKLIKDLYLSTRRGYYCEGATGKVTGDDGASCSNRRDVPIFLNHGLWLDYIQERARSTGDCGYKMSIGEVYGDLNSEKLSVQFQKLNQKGEVISNISYTKVIYLGDNRTKTDYRSSAIFSNYENSFYWRAYTWWKQKK